MENRADVYGVGVLEKGKQLAKQSAGMLRLMGVGFLGVLLSNAALPGGGAPFGIAYAAAAPQGLRLVAAVGAALGYLLHFASGTVGFFSVQWLSLFGIGLALGIGRASRWMESPRSRRENSRWAWTFGLVGTVVGTAAPQWMLGAFTRLTVQDLMNLLSQGVAAMGAYWIFGQTLSLIAASPGRIPQRQGTGAVLVTAGLALAALSRICIYDLSLGRTLALTAVLICCSCDRLYGTAAGVAAGALTALCGAQRGFGYTLPGIWGLGGLLAGVFSPLGRGFCCAALMFGETAAVFLFAQDPMAYVILLEAVLACGIYLLIPVRSLNLVRVWMGGDAAEVGGVVGDLLLHRLHGTAAALSDIAKTTETVADKLMQPPQGKEENLDQIYLQTVQQVCRKCKDGARCWAGCYGDTVSGFRKLHQLLGQRQGVLEPGGIAECFPKGCIHPEELAAQAQRDFQSHLEQREKKRISTRIRGMVTDQFEGMAMVMDTIERQLRLLRRLGREEELIGAYCRKNHLDVDKPNVYQDGDGRMVLELTLCWQQWERMEGARRMNVAAFTADLGEICQRQFAPPFSQREDGKVRLRFVEQPRYQLKTGCTQMGITGSKICGDSCNTFVDGQMRATLLISDGMGTGARAAVDSAMTSGLLTRLLDAGLEPDAGLKLVNAALLVKSDEESLSTVDLIGVDLYTGKTRFYKAGAAPTFLRRCGHGGSVEATSLPAGILRDVKFERASISLREGDMIVMVSDGVVQQDGGGWILKELEQYEGGDPQWLSQHLAGCAKERMEPGKEDDITVLVGLVERC